MVVGAVAAYGQRKGVAWWRGCPGRRRRRISSPLVSRRQPPSLPAGVAAAPPSVGVDDGRRRREEEEPGGWRYESEKSEAFSQPELKEQQDKLIVAVQVVCLINLSIHPDPALMELPQDVLMSIFATLEVPDLTKMNQ
uniref:F-box domain-containing protein n=1 Tax=Oryza rufipogon TaxID=4529 RepID=A0A0E0RA38_ORYRU